MKPMQYQLLCTNLLNIEKKDENESDMSISKLRSESCLMLKYLECMRWKCAIEDEDDEI